VLLTEQSIVGGYTVCAKEQNSKTTGSMAVAQLWFPLQNFKEPERRAGGASVSVRWQASRPDMRNPPTGS
jgi:hypothetical protein